MPFKPYQGDDMSSIPPSGPTLSSVAAPVEPQGAGANPGSRFQVLIHSNLPTGRAQIPQNLGFPQVGAVLAAWDNIRGTNP